MDAVVESFIFPEQDRPTVPYNSFEADLPVIDLSPVLRLDKLQTAGLGATDATKKELQDCESRIPGILHELRRACEKFGLFQIVNHGFPLEYISQTTDSALEFFAKPLEEKEKVTILDSGNKMGYFCKKHPLDGTEAAQRWQEALTLPVQPEHLTDEWAARMWPDSLERMKATRELYKKQALEFEALSVRLLQLIAQSLGLSDTAYYTKSFVNHATKRSGIRLNHYPKCPRPDLTLGLPAHTDPTMTLLHQDAVGGLQVLSDEGKWLGVKPHPGALVVNLGDFFQAWTNNRFKSAIHRAVTNPEKERLSFLFYSFPAHDAIVVAPPELVDSEHPALYRAFTGAAYLTALYSPEFKNDRTRLLPSFMN